MQDPIREITLAKVIVSKMVAKSRALCPDDSRNSKSPVHDAYLICSYAITGFATILELLSLSLHVEMHGG